MSDRGFFRRKGDIVELELTPDETSLLTGILVIWKTRMSPDKYEDMLIGSILQKIFDEDKRLVDKILRDRMESKGMTKNLL